MKALRLLIISFVLLCIVGFGVFIGKLLPRSSPVPPPQIQNTAVILRQVQSLSELVTVKYVMEKVVILEDAKWYGENKVMLVAHGIVKGGIDLKGLKDDDIRVSGKKISVKLPAAIVTDAYLDDKRTKILERSTGVLRTFDKDLEQNARQQAIGAILKGAREIGILKDADERARLQLENLFHRSGFDEVEIETR
jgi:hypothetical protein